jgi:hypothetical protein
MKQHPERENILRAADYIIEMEKHGYHKYDAMHKLHEAGYSKEIVEHSLKQVKRHKTKVFFITLSAIILILAAVFFLMKALDFL